MSENRFSQQPEQNPELTDLDQRYPVSSIRFDDKSKDLIRQREVSGMQWVSIFRNSPAGSSECEIIMGVVLTDSLIAGNWVGPEDPFTVEEENQALNRSGFSTDYPKGFAKLYNLGLATRVETPNGKAKLQPTEKMLQFFEERIGFDRPQAQS